MNGDRWGHSEPDRWGNPVATDRWPSTPPEPTRLDVGPGAVIHLGDVDAAMRAAYEGPLRSNLTTDTATLELFGLLDHVPTDTAPGSVIRIGR